MALDDLGPVLGARPDQEPSIQETDDPHSRIAVIEEFSRRCQP
jgi:hypothetical protein